MNQQPRSTEATIEQYMTTSPHSIGQEQELTVAHDMMRQYRIRHLPVLHGGKLVGMLSQRDLHFIETLKDVDPAKVRVGEAMSMDTYAVAPKSLLRQVAADMGSRRVGSAVVIDKQRVIGIFTTVDAMHVLAGLLLERERETA